MHIPHHRVRKEKPFNAPTPPSFLRASLGAVVVMGKLGQQVLPGVLPPAWLQCPSQSKSPRAAGEESPHLPAAWQQAGGAEENKQVTTPEVSKTPWVRAGQPHRRFHCSPSICTEMPSSLSSVLTEKFSSSRLN